MRSMIEDDIKAIEKILDIVREEGFVSDEYFGNGVLRKFYENFTEKFFRYCRDNFIPYDFEDDMDEFCVDGGILKYRNRLYKIELLNGQGSIATVEILDSGINVKNYVDMERLLKNTRHRDYFKNRDKILINRISTLFSIKGVDSKSAIRICEGVINNYK
ncbi:MAG: hypothetical protein ACRDA3_13165 [Peptostreptococcaceae bacterium]